MTKYKNSIPYTFIKKLVSTKEWNTYYQYQPGYCFLSQEDKQVWIGFISAEEVLPEDCMKCTDEELRRIDLYRSSKHIYPRPFNVITQP